MRLVSSSRNDVEKPNIGLCFLLNYAPDGDCVGRAGRDRYGGFRYAVGDNDNEARHQVEVRFQPMDVWLEIPRSFFTGLDYRRPVDYSTVYLCFKFKLDSDRKPDVFGWPTAFYPSCEDTHNFFHGSVDTPHTLAHILESRTFRIDTTAQSLGVLLSVICAERVRAGIIIEPLSPLLRDDPYRRM